MEMASAFGSGPPSQFVLEPTSRSGPSREDWESQRPLIKRLYVDEGRKLKEVISIVSQTGHKATPKMYKDRITKWGYDKKHKERDMVAILRKKNERDAIGKQSSFRVRGKPITMDEVFYYLKRRKRAQELEISAASTPSAVSCWTPSPANTPRPADDDDDIDQMMFPQSSSFGAALQPFIPGTMVQPHAVGDMPYGGWAPKSPVVDTRQGIFNDDYFYTLLFNHVAVPRSPLPPQALLVSERLLSEIKTYIRGSFDAKTWITDGDGYCLSVVAAARESRTRPSDFYNYCCVAADFLDKGLPIEFRRIFSNVLKMVPDVLLAEHPQTLSLIFESLLRSVRCGFQDVASFLCRQIGVCAGSIFMENHPLRTICQLLGKVDFKSFQKLVGHLWRLNVDTFVDTLGMWNQSAMILKLNFLSSSNEPTDTCRHEKSLRELFAQSTQLFGSHSSQTIDIGKALADNLRRQRRYAEAEVLVQSILVLCQETVVDDPHGLHGILLYILAESQYAQDKRSLAESNLRKGIEIAVRTLSSTDPFAFGFKLQLEKWLREWGRVDEADALNEEISQLIGKDEVDQEIEAGNIVL